MGILGGWQVGNGQVGEVLGAIGQVGSGHA